jgi:hypothetical protein
VVGGRGLRRGRPNPPAGGDLEQLGQARRRRRWQEAGVGTVTIVGGVEARPLVATDGELDDASGDFREVGVPVGAVECEAVQAAQVSSFCAVAVAPEGALVFAQAEALREGQAFEFC